MRKVRNYVFETNSSSTHSIAVPNFEVETSIEKLVFEVGSYGWKFRQVKPHNYLYTFLYCEYAHDTEELEDKLNLIKKVLNNHNIKCYFIKPKMYYSHGYVYLDEGGIDHCDEAESILETIMRNEETLYKFLIGGLVFTGNDNTSNNDQIMKNHRNEKNVDIYLGYDEIAKESKWKTVENEYYKPEYDNYTWYEKSN